MLLLKCCLRGTKIHRGIDISDEAIKAAGETQKLSGIEGFTFTAGGAEELQAIADSAFDGVILSNIIDNLLPEDAIVVLAETRRYRRMDRTVGKLF